MKSAVQNRSHNSSKGAIQSGHKRSASKNSDAASSSATKSTASLTHENLLAIMSKSVGKSVIASTSNGFRYRGQLVNSDFGNAGNGPLSVMLKSPTLVSKPANGEKTNVSKDLPSRLIIPARDLVDLEVLDVKSREVDEKSTFKTDTDISNSRPIKERELEQWVPDAAVDSKLNFSLEDDKSHWDQFKVNQEKFGIESTYDEHLYTTRINTQAPDYHEKLKRAAQLAKEIENDVTNDPHLLEERGKIVDNGLDEESKYSGVDRRGDELMAALKSVNLNASPAPDVGGHDNSIDPAIVSSSIKESSKSNKKPDSIPDKPQIQRGESFRLNAQSEINSLKEFSANFKVPHKMPNDLLPILAKDKSKQNEILKRQQDAPAPGSNGASASNSSSTTPQSQKVKLDPSKSTFKLNPKAAVFTPASRPQQQSSPNPPPKLPYNSRSPSSRSPRSNHSRPYTNATTGNKRHYQISPGDFFGGTNKIPTKDSQVEKAKKFRASFSLFITAQHKAASGSKVVIEKPFATPPVWKSTIDDTHDKLFPPADSVKPVSMMPTSPYRPSPVIAGPVQGVYPGLAGAQTAGKFPLSPQQQQAAAMAAQAHFQQMQAAMFYQQQQYGAVPPMQQGMPGVYLPGSNDATAFLPPQGLYPPTGYNGGSPVNSHMIMGSPYASGSHSNYNGHRRYATKRSN